MKNVITQIKEELFDEIDKSNEWYRKNGFHKKEQICKIQNLIDELSFLTGETHIFNFNGVNVK